MELKIYWTIFAKSELQKIFNYYTEIASLNVAKKLVTGITKETIKLQKNPLMGQKEELLENSLRQYRYLIFKNYKNYLLGKSSEQFNRNF